MCFLYWQRHRRTARRRGWREARGAAGAKKRFPVQTGQRWPFNLAHGPAESLIKLWAMKTEQTAKPTPETDTLFLSYSHLTISFLFSIIPFNLLATEGKNRTQRLGWHSWAEVWGEKGGGGGWAEMSPIQSQAMWAQTEWWLDLSAWASGLGESRRRLWLWRILAWLALVAQQILLLESCCLRKVTYEVCLHTVWQPSPYTLRVQSDSHLLYITVCKSIYVHVLIEIQPQYDFFKSLLCNICFADVMCGHSSVKWCISSGKLKSWLI